MRTTDFSNIDLTAAAPAAAAAPVGLSFSIVFSVFRFFRFSIVFDWLYDRLILQPTSTATEQGTHTAFYYFVYFISAKSIPRNHFDLNIVHTSLIFPRQSYPKNYLTIIACAFEIIVNDEVMSNLFDPQPMFRLMPMK
jgi:hypothetical protein